MGITVQVFHHLLKLRPLGILPAIVQVNVKIHLLNVHQLRPLQYLFLLVLRRYRIIRLQARYSYVTCCPFSHKQNAS